MCSLLSSAWEVLEASQLLNQRHTCSPAYPMGADYKIPLLMSSPCQTRSFLTVAPLTRSQGAVAECNRHWNILSGSYAHSLMHIPVCTLAHVYSYAYISKIQIKFTLWTTGFKPYWYILNGIFYRFMQRPDHNKCHFKVSLTIIYKNQED